MREIGLHRRADRALDRIPAQRRNKIFEAIEELATLADVLSHRNVKRLSGNLAGKYRLRVGAYRIVFELQDSGEVKVLFIHFIGVRGDAY